MAQQSIRAWKIGLFFLVAVVVLMGATIWFMPRSYQVSRSLVVDAPARAVFAALQDVQRWPSWLVWLGPEVDPTVHIDYGSATHGEGAEVRYRGERLGQGRFSLFNVRARERLDFTAYQGPEGHEERVGVHRMVLEAEGDATRVIWSMVGEVGEATLAGLAVGSRERLAVHDFDASLRALKACVEQGDCVRAAGAHPAARGD